MEDFEYIQKFEEAIILIENARDITKEIGEDLLYDALDKIRDDMKEQLEEEGDKL